LFAYAGGVTAGFAVPVLPFAALAPRKFYEAIIVAQIGPRAHATRASLWGRIQELTGLADLTRSGHLLDLAAAVLIVAVVAGSLSLAYLLTWRLPPPLEAFAVATAALVIASFVWPDQFQYHYAAFFAPWLSLAIALPLAALVRDLRLVSGGDGATPPALQRGAAGLAGLLILVLAVVQFGSESHVIAHLPLSVVTSARHLIPPGACLLADEVSFSVVTDRLVSDVPGCSLFLDATGTNYALSHGRDPETGAARYPQVDAMWTYAFDHAKYVWLSGFNNHRVAWTPALRGYFQSHFTRILHAGNDGSLYRRIGLRPVG
jgi:hypothetical protein